MSARERRRRDARAGAKEEKREKERNNKTVEIVHFMENSIKIGFHCERINFLARQPLQW